MRRTSTQQCYFLAHDYNVFYFFVKSCSCTAQACAGTPGRRVPPLEVRQQHYELRLSGEEPLSLTAARLGHSICRILFIYFPPCPPPVATAEANHNLPDPKNLKPEQRPRFTSPQTRLSDSKRRAGGGRSKSISEMNCPRRCYQIREMTSFWSHSL